MVPAEKAAVGSMPGYRRPVLIVQADNFNRSRIQTVLVVVLTSNLRLASAPGNVLLPARATGLSKDSVANVSQVITVDKSLLTEEVSQLCRQHRVAGPVGAAGDLVVQRATVWFRRSDVPTFGTAVNYGIIPSV